MKLKTTHRKENPKPELPADLPTVETTAPEAPAVSAVSIETEGTASPETIDEALQTAAQADEAALMLKRQIDELRRAEEMQHKASMMADPRTLPLEDRIRLWQQNGLSDAEAQFIREHPEIGDHPQISNHAAALALRDGYERDSAEYFEAVLGNFQQHMEHMQAQAAAQAPEFFRPPPPRQPAPPSRSAIVSAPVSRDVPSGGTRELRPNQVRLTPEQVEAARVAGISTIEYARHLLRLEAEKRAGIRQ